MDKKRKKDELAYLKVKRRAPVYTPKEDMSGTVKAPKTMQRAHRKEVTKQIRSVRRSK